ncbi:MAG: hypothetical protein IT454_12990 [Planctomycetes bacterium]|nr:hypothetical protein [Planctomycetota bacterium]
MHPMSIRLALAAACLSISVACSDVQPAAPTPAPDADATAGTQTPQGTPNAGVDPGKPFTYQARVETPTNAKAGDQVHVKEFHPNGQLATERTELVLPDLKRVRVGPMKAFWENGALRVEGGYDDEGRLAGHWKYFDDAAQLLREGDYESGMRTGEWVEFHPNGRKRSQGFVHANLFEGAWVYWHDNGQKMAEGSYINNRREGVWLFWNEKGEPDPQFTGSYKNGEKLP